MGYKLCVAEKPSVAQTIAKVFGANKKCNGYFEGNGYRVTWAVGHLVGLAEPEAYGYVRQTDTWGDDEAKKKEAYDQLPLFPDEFKLIVLPKTRAQYKIVETLMKDPQCDEVIDCGDMGPEGHILQWLIREKVGCTKEVRRFCAVDMSDKAMKTAMANLRPIEDFKKIIEGEFCKKKADWVLGMSMSRAASMKYKAGIDVGRVQSPTLWFIVKRYLEVKNFKVTNYFTMEAKMQSGFSVFWNKDTGRPKMFFDDNKKDKEGRVLDEQAVKDRCNEITSEESGKVIELVKEVKTTNRPQLYDIIELQKEANRRYGYTAAMTLATAQALYETQKVLSYPRTDSRYITENLVQEVKDRIKGLTGLTKYATEAESLITNGMNFDSHVVNEKKVTDHHALIVTEDMDGFDPSAMKPTQEEARHGVTAESMRNILDMVITSMIVALSQPYVYEQTSVAVQFPNTMVFTATGRIPKEMGWKGVKERLDGKETEEVSAEKDKEQLFPALKKGDLIRVEKCLPVAKKTTPPKLHTEATLLTAMQNAGSELGKDGKILQGRGIGTQATRAEIIKKLFDKKCCETVSSGKIKYIQPTLKGMNVIRVLPPQLYSPAITARWETMIAEIVEGKRTEQDFLNEFKVFINEKVAELKAQDTAISFATEKLVVGECPWCGADLYRYSKKGVKNEPGFISHYCSNRDNCNFSFKTTDKGVVSYTHKSLTETQLKHLIENGVLRLKYKTKWGKEARCEMTLIKREGKDGKIYANVNIESVPHKA